MLEPLFPCFNKNWSDNECEGETKISMVEALLIAALVLVVLFYLWRQAGQLSANNVEHLIKSGAVVVDVRSEAEFSAGHIGRAINIPIEQLQHELPKQVESRRTPLLLHCQSGSRSAHAKKMALALGYSTVYNLGSYYRAAELIKI